MHPTMHLLCLKILVIIPLLALLGILIFKKINENFNTNIPKVKITLPISNQLTTQISQKLGISARRITNISFNGDINNGYLNVSFTVLDPNLMETGKGEPSAQSCINNAHNLFNNNQFTVEINGLITKLYKATSVNTDQAINKSDYFDNQSMLDISKYAQGKYITAPNDVSYTNFFTLKPDTNYNLNPVLQNST